MTENSTIEKILKQVEYYFGDINLPRDKFLQEELKKDSGWVPISTLLTFNRLRSVTTDPNEIATSLRTSSLLDVSEDNTKIKRKQEAPLPDDTLEYWQELRKRTVFMEGFPEITTLDEVEDFVKKYGQVQNVIMRKTSPKDGKKMYKGSSLVTFSDVETAKKFSEIPELKFKDFNIATKMQEQYMVDKKNERSIEKEIKKNKKKELIGEQKAAQNKAYFVKGSVLKAQGFKVKEATVEEVKKFFEPYGNPEYVKLPEGDSDSSIYVRFSKENEAQDIIDKLKKADENEGNIYKEEKITAILLEGADEEAYWSDFSKKRNEKAGKRTNKFSKNQRNKPHGAKRTAVKCEEEIEMKKSKRIVFTDDDGVPEP